MRQTDQELRKWAVKNRETVQLNNGTEFDGTKYPVPKEEAVAPAFTPTTIPDIEPAQTKAVDDAEELRKVNASLLEQLDTANACIAKLSLDIAALKLTKEPKPKHFKVAYKGMYEDMIDTITPIY